MPDISALAQELIKREVAQNPRQFNPKPAFDLGLDSGPTRPAMKAVNPHLLATLAGLTDAATTYYFLKRDRGTEQNALLGATGNNPELTALAALGGLGASKFITRLLGKANPKAADALAANLGTLQAAYSVGNVSDFHNGGSSEQYQRAMTNKVIQGK